MDCFLVRTPSIGSTRDGDAILTYLWSGPALSSKLCQ